MNVTYRCCYRTVGDNHADYCAGGPGNVPPILSLEELRDFVIQNAVTLLDERAQPIDVVALSDFVAFYEHLTGRDFYKNRAAPAIPGNVEDAPPHTFANYTPSDVCGCGDRNCQGHSE